MAEPSDHQHNPEGAGTTAAIGEPEPWAGWETRLCLWSLALGIGGLLVLAVLLHSFLL